MIKHLEKIFSKARKYILEEGYKKIKVIRTNPKATDMSREFDLGTESVVINYCRENNLRIKILTEERGEVNICEDPKWILILDPVDGSTNLKRGIEGSAVSMAVLPAAELLQPENVRYALIGSIISGGYCMSEKGKGVFYRGPFSGNKKVRVSTSKNENLETACIEIDFDFALDETTSKINIEKGKKIKRILPLIFPERRIKHIRRNGSAAIGLMEVATGAIDAYIDARDISTPENWLAAYLLIKEAGGIFTDLRGKEIAKIKSLAEPYSYIASGNKILHQAILESLDR